MKKVLLIIFASVTLYTGCKKQDEELTAKQDVNQEYDSYSQIPIPIHQISVYQGRLVFANMSAYQSTQHLLEMNKDAWDHYLIDEYDSLSDDSASELIFLTNVRYEQPFIDFQDQLFGFNSLLVKIENEMDDWLDHTVLDEENDPDNHFVGNNLDRAVLNEDAEIIIGNDGYKYFENYILKINGLTIYDSVLTIDQICDIMDDISSELIDPEDTTTVYYTLGIFDPLGNSKNNLNPGCSAQGIEEDHDFEYFGGHRLKWRVQINTPLIGSCNSMAMTRNYRKRNNGKWIRYWTNTKVKVYGYKTNPSDCDKDDFESDVHERKAFDLSVKKNTTLCMAESGDVKGWHYGAAGNSYISTLTF